MGGNSALLPLKLWIGYWNSVHVNDVRQVHKWSKNELGVHHYVLGVSTPTPMILTVRVMHWPTRGVPPTSCTSHCPTDSCRNPVIPAIRRNEAGIHWNPEEWDWNLVIPTGMKLDSTGISLFLQELSGQSRPECHAGKSSEWTAPDGCPFIELVFEYRYTAGSTIVY
jgi:hypothetical protein